jgi:hypothetical protein
MKRMISNNVRSDVPPAFPIIARILRTVPDENAFYFYKQAGYYLDVRARSLGEFLEKLNSVDLISLQFHIERGDFENWLLTTLGDATLARQVYSCRTKQDGALRSSLISFVGTRLARLQKFQ